MKVPLELIQALDEEFERATATNGSFHSAHEGYAVLLEEVDELKEWVWKKDRDRNPIQMKKEAIQVAAMAIRFITDVCETMEMPR